MYIALGPLFDILLTVFFHYNFQVKGCPRLSRQGKLNRESASCLKLGTVLRVHWGQYSNLPFGHLYKEDGTETLLLTPGLLTQGKPRGRGGGGLEWG